MREFFPMKRLAALAATLCLLAGPAQADTITLSDPGSDFDVVYDTNNLGLFGTPALVNNVIFFTPTDFDALSTNGEGINITNSTVTVRLIAKDPNFNIASFFVSEDGDYKLDGPGAEVDVHGQLRIFDPNGPFPFTMFTKNLTHSDLSINDNELHNWTAMAMIDQNDGWQGSNEVVLTLENILEAETINANTSAFIEKKFAGIQIQVNPVPLPGAVWLFGSALFGLGAARRRRSTA